MNADSLSRLSLDSISTAEIDDSTYLFNIQQIATLPVDLKQLLLETSNDSVLSRGLRYINQGWPQDVNAELCPFFICKLEITIESGCLMWGIKVIVPNKLQGRVLEELHTGHTGIVRMKL